MTINAESSLQPRQRAGEIARRTLNGEYDLLLACRDLADLSSHLQGVPEDVVDTFVGVACEVDGLPIGAERRYWSLNALRANDIEISKYREQVRDVVTEALLQLVTSLAIRKAD